MKIRTLKSALFLLCLFMISSGFMAGCGERRESKEHNRLKIITTLFPLYDFAKNIAGEKADVTLILPPGVEPHSFEPKPKDILKINSADIFIYTGRFMEPWAEHLIKGIENKTLSIIDASSGIKFLTSEKGKHYHEGSHEGSKSAEPHHGNTDPHIWLDLSNVKIMIDNILKGLIKKDPVNRDYYEKNAGTYRTKIVKLDEKFKKKP